MRRLGRIWNALRLLNSARELAVETRRCVWNVSPPVTLFLQAEHCDVVLSWRDQARIRATLELQAGFGWQWTSDQDDAGVYMVVRRKPLIGGLGRGRVAFTLPPGIHISLELEDCQLICRDLRASLELPPFQQPLGKVAENPGEQ